MENMIDSKDVMWALWCVILCVLSYKVGNMIGVARGLHVAKSAVIEMLHKGVLVHREGK